MLRWMTALSGLFLTVFAAVALSGPGRIDIIDGKVRYEVARSIVDHGDVDIRDPKIVFTVLPGRGGRRYSQYRFPNRPRAWPRSWPPTPPGRRVRPAVDSSSRSRARSRVRCWLPPMRHSSAAWASDRKPPCSGRLAGIFCTPNWYYGTSTFDDILGTAAVVLAVALGAGVPAAPSPRGAVAAGLALGLAFNCKQPLGIFVLPVMAALYDPGNRLAVAMGAAGDRRRPAGRRGCRIRELRMVQVPSRVDGGTRRAAEE